MAYLDLGKGIGVVATMVVLCNKGRVTLVLQLDGRIEIRPFS